MQFINKIIISIALIICIMMQVFSAPINSDNTTLMTTNTITTTTTTTTSKTKYRYTTKDNDIVSSCLAVGFIILFLICIFLCCKHK